MHEDEIDTEEILGVHVSAINLEMAVETIDRWIASGAHDYVCLTDVNGVMNSHRNSGVRQAYNGTGLATPDGRPLVWLLRRAGWLHVDRVYEPDLMMAVFAAGEDPGYTHFLYGTTDETLGLLRRNLLAKFPHARIVGGYAPPFRDSGISNSDDIAQLNQSGADIIWVALGAPKQELWMATNRAALSAPVLIGVGAAFDFHAGIVKQAPRFIQRSGFEWLYRMLREPRRLAARCLRNNPAFVVLIMHRMLRPA